MKSIRPEEIQVGDRFIDPETDETLEVKSLGFDPTNPPTDDDWDVKIRVVEPELDENPDLDTYLINNHGEELIILNRN